MNNNNLVNTFALLGDGADKDATLSWQHALEFSHFARAVIAAGVECSDEEFADLAQQTQYNGWSPEGLKRKLDLLLEEKKQTLASQGRLALDQAHPIHVA